MLGIEMSDNHATGRFARTTECNDYVIVTFNGTLNGIDFQANESFQLRDELNAVVDLSAGRPVIIDFEHEWWHVCAAIYGNFVQMHKKLNGKLLVCNLSDSAQDAFQMNQLATLFNIYTTRDEAISSLGAS